MLRVENVKKKSNKNATKTKDSNIAVNIYYFS
jgi:hypothetical protein